MNWLEKFRCFYLGITPTEMKQIVCAHKNVELRSVQPVTLRPKRGKCKDCGKIVKAKLTWE